MKTVQQNIDYEACKEVCVLLCQVYESPDLKDMRSLRPIYERAKAALSGTSGIKKQNP